MFGGKHNYISNVSLHFKKISLFFFYNHFFSHCYDIKKSQPLSYHEVEII